MRLIDRLTQGDLLHPGMQILDVGCGDGRFAEFFTQFGDVDALDQFDDVTADKTKFNFIHVNLRDFKPDKQYDLIFARNVFFITKDPIKYATHYAEFLKVGGIYTLTFMGVNDPWAVPSTDPKIRQYSTVTTEQVEEFMKSFEVIWYTEDNTEHVQIDEDSKKKWHLYKMILRKK